MVPRFVALTTLSDRVRLDDLAIAAAALQVQVMRDLAPEWGAMAIIVAAPFDSLPAGAVPLIVRDQCIDTDGFRRTRRDDTPYITVPYGRHWPLAASHELLRFLVDPAASARLPGPSRLTGQATVEFLLDVCGPCHGINSSYAINGVPVSDFTTRAFFGMPGQRFSFTGAAEAPFQPAPSGIVTWLADDDRFYQARADGNGRISVHGGFASVDRPIWPTRAFIDSLTPGRLAALSGAMATDALRQAEQNARRTRFTSAARLRDDLNERHEAEATASSDVPANVFVLPPIKSGQNSEVAPENWTGS